MASDHLDRRYTDQEVALVLQRAAELEERRSRALTELRDGAPLRSRSLLGPLIQLVEDRVAAAGTVSEAIGSVRWTSVNSNNNLAPVTQVSFTPGASETHLQVTRRYGPPVRLLVNLLPGLWSGIIGLGVAGSASLALLPAIGVVAGSVAAGLLIGRGVWHRVARRNRERVDRLTADLTEEGCRVRTAGPQAGGG